MREQAPDVSIRHLCRILGVNRRWYYQQRQRKTQEDQNAKLCCAIEQIILAFPGYGYRRVTHTLTRAGWEVNHKRVLRIMRERCWLCHQKKRKVFTTDSRHAYRRYPNLVGGHRFDAPDQCWVADLTYIRLPSEFVYLACILDVFTRQCVGWHLGRGLDSSLTLHALEMALQQRDIQPGLIMNLNNYITSNCSPERASGVVLWVQSKKGEASRMETSPSRP